VSVASVRRRIGQKHQHILLRRDLVLDLPTPCRRRAT
jgi:hypothetical protein